MRGGGVSPVSRGWFPPPPAARPVAQALSPPLGAGAMPAPESRSVFEAAQDPVLLQGLTLVTGVAADVWATEPAPVSHGTWGSVGGLFGQAHVRQPQAATKELCPQYSLGGHPGAWL